MNILVIIGVIVALIGLLVLLGLIPGGAVLGVIALLGGIGLAIAGSTGRSLR